MKTPSAWVTELSSATDGHLCGCVCDRCKEGLETFLLERDIAEIQHDALMWAICIISEAAVVEGDEKTKQRRISECFRRAAELIFDDPVGNQTAGQVKRQLIEEFGEEIAREALGTK